MAGPSENPVTTPASPPRVVILGGGYGGVYTALRLQKAAKRGELELSLISRDNYFLSQPMLAEVVSGSIEPPHIVNPIRRLLPQASFHQAEIVSIETDSRNVVINYGGDSTHFNRIPYDHLVIAVGSSTDLSKLTGMAEHALPFKTLGHAFKLRNHLIGVLEEAEVEANATLKRELLTFLVAGGGYTGVEVAAEMNSFMQEAAKSYPHIEQDDIKVILLHRGARILPVLDKKLAEFSHVVLERHGLEIRLGISIEAATARSAILDDGDVIPTRTLVAAIGSAPNPLLDKTTVKLGQRGRVIVDKTLAVPGHPGLWAVGDCAAVPDGDGTCPPTAQYALKQAQHLARNILAEIRDNPLRPFSHKSLGVFVPLGWRSAAAEVRGFKLSGFLAWWLYRTFYLLQLPTLERKLRVVIDWTLELAFRRDIVQMDTSRSQRVSRAHYEPNELIYGEDDLARNFYIILVGQVAVVEQRAEGESWVATLEAGEYFGDMSLRHDGLRHSKSVRALTPTDLLIMSGPDFKELASSSTDFKRTLDEVQRRRLSNSGAPPESRAGREERSGPEIPPNQREP